jgi:ribosomal protein L44E
MANTNAAPNPPKRRQQMKRLEIDVKCPNCKRKFIHTMGSRFARLLGVREFASYRTYRHQ